MRSIKQLYRLLLCSLLGLYLFSGCGKQTSPVSGSSPSPSISDTSISAASTSPPEPEPTTPEHSELYIPGISVEDVILYFNEVCLDAEIIYTGDPSRLQKWDSPIYFMLHGQYTNEDLATLSAFTDWLNSIHGFPGIFQTQNPDQASLHIHFCSQQEMLNLMGDHFSGLDGAVTFWYADDVIYNAIICCRTDLDQFLRNSVILEELYNGLGPIQDTNLRSDSIIYAEFSEPQTLTEVDQLLLKLLYHPRLECGMDAEACEAVIRQLYY